MLKNVLEYLETTTGHLPDKVSFSDDNNSLTFSMLQDKAMRVGTYLYNHGIYKEPVVVFMEKGPDNIAAFFGAVYGGNSYVPIDDEMPSHRIQLIFKSLNPRAVICDDKTKTLAMEFDFDGELLSFDEIVLCPADMEVIGRVREKHIDTDPVYIIYTSGSTGVPKGVVASHRSLIDYIESLSDVLGFSEDTVFANQAPLYFDASMKELYQTIKHGATTFMVPKSLFMFPVKLIEYLNEHKINTICWVVSALSIVATFDTFETVVPQYVHTVTFVGEVLPIKHLNTWRSALPGARFVNLYGPTEITGVCCYFDVERNYNLDEVIPIGKPLNNTDIFLLDDDNLPTNEGEICVRGACLAHGYYGDPERTAAAFVQNPLNNAYPELIYRTGDIGRYDEDGNLVFMSRKDFQIKHMGHRIELGEIEAVVHAIHEVERACALFDDVNKKIILYYAGSISEKDMVKCIKDKLPRYMVPNYIKKLDALPLTPSSKINRVLLKEMYENK
ncbi:MAG: amino acid adenylation domain-containing protein [Lachnospiraceae bacterium]|jgi:D-alanine--poly(phosphoribitol) ligase subunit 1